MIQSSEIDELSSATGESMDTAQVITAAGLFIGIFAILFGIFTLMWQMNRQSTRLEAKMDAQGKELRAEIETQGKRVSQSELEQARLNGVNSVLLQQTHTHQNVGDDD